MRRLVFACSAILSLLAAPAVSWAQAGTPAQALTTCGSPVNAPVQGNYYSITMNTLSQLCVVGATTTTPAGATSTDASGTVTLGGTYQTVFAASATRKGCLIQNPTTATEVLNVRVGTTTVFNLLAGGTFACGAAGGIVVTDTISVTAATTGHAFSANSQ